MGCVNDFFIDTTYVNVDDFMLCTRNSLQKADHVTGEDRVAITSGLSDLDNLRESSLPQRGYSKDPDKTGDAVVSGEVVSGAGKSGESEKPVPPTWGDPPPPPPPKPGENPKPVVVEPFKDKHGGSTVGPWMEPGAPHSLLTASASEITISLTPGTTLAPANLQTLQNGMSWRGLSWLARHSATCRSAIALDFL